MEDIDKELVRHIDKKSVRHSSPRTHRKLYIFIKPLISFSHGLDFDKPLHIFARLRTF